MPEPLGAKRGPGKTRALVLQHKLEGMTVREIASRLRISPQAVYQHLASIKENGVAR